ncbi:phosphate ABC transporter permease PstA [Ostreibacterium oceani]|uniref:Phosphate transport system permease protein PstA n=1 Tax=Ostreibacterium oceani TaxID=2654998 RepID=A0A6N7EVR6_9GAMM|nr:phosphate ABC transporter permease PstA [Ostreibacterium oceani]MPV86582.1 phosphate ABC transporter permease PstA [Ostreibacterium oceani]
MNKTEQVKAGLKKRYRKEKRFQYYGLSAIILAFVFLCILLTDIVTKALPAFTQHYIQLDVQFDADKLNIDTTAGTDTTDAQVLSDGNYRKLLGLTLNERFPFIENAADRREFNKLLSNIAPFTLRDTLVANPSLLGQSTVVEIKLDDAADLFIKSGGLSGETVKNQRISAQQATWLGDLYAEDKIIEKANWSFLSSADSREPEQAGISGAVKGTLLTILITLVIAFPIAVSAAIYLEEFAPKNRITDFIEININNLASVPSIVFGLLGLAIFINFFGMPRSAPLVGGLVLALMTLPTIIISSRAAIKSVSPSLKEGALGLGASKTQTVFHQVLPQAMPGILTGTIIGIAQAIGETAPLLMIGMVAFIVDLPETFTDSATVLPVQIYLWSNNPEHTFVAKTSAAIIVLLLVLLVINALAIYLRKRFEKK